MDLTPAQQGAGRYGVAPRRIHAATKRHFDLPYADKNQAADQQSADRDDEYGAIDREAEEHHGAGAPECLFRASPGEASSKS